MQKAGQVGLPRQMEQPVGRPRSGRARGRVGRNRVRGAEEWGQEGDSGKGASKVIVKKLGFYPEWSGGQNHT